MTGKHQRASERLSRVLSGAMERMGPALERVRVAAPSAVRRLGRPVAVAGAVAATGAGAYAAARAFVRRPEVAPGEGMDLHAAVTVKCPRDQVYRFWHRFEQLPRFMIHVESVTTVDGITHWKARGPAGKAVEWDAEIVEDLRDEVISWRSTSGALVPNSGTVRFGDAPGGRGTEVRVHLRYDPPGGRAGLALARLLGEHPEQQVRDDLRRFKQVLETGEVVRSEGSPEGTRALRQLKQRPAQPVR
ncbi:SRPBCC family protein [Microbispora sp. KK1-11]|uniref:SRPBCC family protein n=1 Tax=Microbispora sp. KK1-11 TaxID=2053005 RepID=UPI0011576668|nr:SRPBCC family protein [Microbispora sp. KK1-11]TQS28416.1 SRPBCC family protein [Microbispora sp. KK1-11]